MLGAWFGVVWEVSGYDGRRRACVGGERRGRVIGGLTEKPHELNW